MLYWLERWGVFYPVPNTKEFIQKLYKELSQEIHANLAKILFNTIFRELLLDRFLMAQIIDVIDIMIVATLNTVNNVIPKMEAKLEHLNKEDFLVDLKNAGLKYSEKRLAGLII